MTHDPRLVLADHAPRIPGVGDAVPLRAVLPLGHRAMTTWRTTWIPADHFAPDHADFWARQPADHYADIQRQLGARDVGVVALPETGQIEPLEGHRAPSGARVARDARATNEAYRGAERREDLGGTE